MDFWMEWILWDFLVKNIDSALIKQSHTNSWDFVILFQTLVCRHLFYAKFFLLFLRHILQKSIDITDSFFLSFGIISCHFVCHVYIPICWFFIVWFVVTFLSNSLCAMFFFIPISCFYTSFTFLWFLLFLQQFIVFFLLSKNDSLFLFYFMTYCYFFF